MKRQEKETEYPMKWYKFAVYFQLFAFAALNVLQGIMHLMGFIFGYGKASVIVERYPELKIVDIIMAVFAFLVAILCLVDRQLLWHYKVQGPKIYLLVMALSGVQNFLYSALSSIVIRLPIFRQYDIGGLISTIVIVILCRNYFKERAALFTE